MSSIGKQLAHARAARQLSIEDVAFHTRIPAARLRDLEKDDLSRFANLVYARGFLKIYSQYLDLDISEYLDQFSVADFAEVSGHEYIQTATATQNLPVAVINDQGRTRMPGLYTLLTAVALAAGIYLWSSSGADGKKELESSVDSAAARVESPPAPRKTPASAPAVSVAATDAKPSDSNSPPAPVESVGAAPDPASAAVAANNDPVEPQTVPPVPGPNGAIKAEVVPEDDVVETESSGRN